MDVPVSVWFLGLCIAMVGSALGFPASAGGTTPQTAKLPAASERPVDFVRDVQPIFANHCSECRGAKKQESDFRLDVKAVVLRGGESGKPAVILGHSADSPLILRVSGWEEEISDAASRWTVPDPTEWLNFATKYEKQTDHSLLGGGDVKPGSVMHV